MRDVLGQTSAALGFEDGRPVLRLDPTNTVTEDDSVELYAGDYCLAIAPLLSPPGRSKQMVATFEDFDPPMLEFPTSLRAIVVRTGEELGTGLALKDTSSLLAALAVPDMLVQLSGIGPDHLNFDISLDRLLAYPRSFQLLLDGRETSSAATIPRAGRSQDLTLPIPAPLRNGTHVELIDTATNVSVFTVVASWMNLVWPIALKTRTLEKQLEQCRKEIQGLNARLVRMLDMDQDRLLLERLDLFYFLLSERIDRVSANGAPPTPPEPATPPLSSTTLRVPPRALEGIGFYDLEGTSDSEWRWFGPRVLLAFRQLAGRPTRVVLKFYRFAHNDTSPNIRVSVNDAGVAAALSAPEPDHYLLDIPVLASMWRADHTLLVQLQFPGEETSTTDHRQLSAVFKSAELFLDGPTEP